MRTSVIRTADATALVRTVREPARIDVDGARWVVAVVQGSRVLNVADDLAAAGYRPCCPLETRITRPPRRDANGRWPQRVLQRPVFGGYLIVGEVSVPLFRSSHRHIIDVLGDRENSRAVSPEFVRRVNDEELAGMWDFRAKRTPAMRFHPGDIVRMPNDGPFHGFFAKVVEAHAKAGVTVELGMFGRMTSITVKDEALELA